MSEHHALFTARISKLVEIQEHFAHFLPEVRVWDHLFEGFVGDRVVAVEADVVDVAPGFEHVDPGERAAGAEDGFAGRGLEGGADEVAGVFYGVEMREGGIAGTELGESIGAVGLLFFVRSFTVGNAVRRDYFGGLGHQLPIAHVHPRLHD